MSAKPLRIDLPPKNDPTRFDVEGLVYVIPTLPRPRSREPVLVKITNESGQALVYNRTNLYSLKDQQRFVEHAARRCGRDPDQIYGHVTVILDAVERRLYQKAKPDPVTPEREERARALLRAPDLLARAVLAIDALGYVGEERNKALAYLVATSRLLPRPASAVILAPSSSGKSDLLDKVARLLPAEDVRSLDRITPSALHYAEADFLTHKLVVVDEQEGASAADLAIRVLQSKGALSQAVAVGGKLRDHTVQGPIALLSGTTSTRLNPENLSRCLELTLDDSPEQTRRIQEAQRKKWTGVVEQPLDAEPFQDAQRLLEPLRVVIPFAERLRFPARTPHDRRGNEKLMALVAAHALLYQRQRRRDSLGRLLATPADYAAVHALVRSVFADDVAGLSPRAVKALRFLESAGTASTTRDLATGAGWSFNTAKAALADLVEVELAVRICGDRPARFKPLGCSPLGSQVELTPPAALTG